jgi:hypothetical protein
MPCKRYARACVYFFGGERKLDLKRARKEESHCVFLFSVQLPPLFDGCTFFFTKEGDVSSPGCLPRKELEHLVERGGGTVITWMGHPVGIASHTRAN